MPLDFPTISANFISTIEEDIKSGHGLEYTITRLWLLTIQHDVPSLATLNRREFRARLAPIIRLASSSAYSARRHMELMEGNYEFIIWRVGDDCGAAHQSLDGLTLPADHSFWLRYPPPLDVFCGCYLLGASSMRIAKRMGGVADVALPQWANLPRDYSTVDWRGMILDVLRVE